MTLTQTDADGNIVWEGHEPDDDEVCSHGVRLGVYCIKCDWGLRDGCGRR